MIAFPCAAYVPGGFMVSHAGIPVWGGGGVIIMIIMEGEWGSAQQLSNFNYPTI